MKLTSLLIVFMLILVGCSVEDKDLIKCNAKIIDVYQNDFYAKGGVVVKEWKTLIEIENASRAILNGRYGQVNDTLIVYVTKDGWIEQQRIWR